MVIPRLNRIMLLTELHLRTDILNECCSSVTLANSHDVIWQPQGNFDKKNSEHNLYAVKNVPEYLTINFSSNKKLHSKKYPSIKGFAISLENYSDINSYMQDQFKSKARSQFLRRLRRLQKCYSIRYKWYYGKIDENQCSTLLTSLKEMIITRFLERNQVSDSLKNWTQIQTTLYSLIIDKKASLYVVYNENKPISISICYHYGDVVFSYIDSYDIDYYKFGLGNILIYKKLELCFENKNKFLDMGWGELDYKKRWCNHIYNFQHHILMPNNSFPAYLMALVEGRKTRFKAYIKSSKIYSIFEKAKKLLKSEKSHKKVAINYSFENFENSIRTEKLVQVNPSNEGSFNFNAILNDFIYKTEEHCSNVKLFKSPNEGLYVIKGKNQCKKIVFFVQD